MPNRLYRHYAKQWIDRLLAIAALIILAPLIALTALVVRIGLGRGVLFVQDRAGLHGQTFTLYKFRTMLSERDSQQRLLPDEQRLIGLGRWLRKYSLDELPQLWNVLRGDLSIVGPRPLLAQYLPRYSAEQARRHEVPPGITGWAQINGRNAISWEEKFQLDIWYVDHQSFWLDLKIVLRTIWIVFSRANVNAAGYATMPEFRPSNRHSS